MSKKAFQNLQDNDGLQVVKTGVNQQAPQSNNLLNNKPVSAVTPQPVISTPVGKEINLPNEIWQAIEKYKTDTRFSLSTGHYLGVSEGANISAMYYNRYSITEPLLTSREWMDKEGHKALYETSRVDLMTEYAAYCTAHYASLNNRLSDLLKEQVTIIYKDCRNRFDADAKWTKYCAENGIKL